MNFLLKIIFFSIIIVAGGVRAAEIDNIRFSNIDADNGLPSNAVSDMLHDSRGFMWIGTRKGICRYDGYDIRVYCRDSIVKCFFEDSHGRLWVGTESGAMLYNHKMDSFETVATDTQANYILTCFAETGGTVYLSSFVGLFRFDEEKRIFVPLSAIGFRVNDMMKDDRGVLWLATPRGVWTIDPSHPESAAVLDLPPTQREPDPATLTLARDARGRIWIGKWNGVRVYDPENGSCERPLSAALVSGVVRAIEFDPQGNVWVGGEDGLHIVSTGGEVRHVSRGVRDVTGIGDNSIYVIYRDHNDNMWVGTYFGGVDVMFRNTSGFSNYSYGFSDRHLSGKAVRQIIADGDKALWIATEDGGLNHLDRPGRRFTHHTGTGKGIGLNYHNVHSLLTDRRGELWIGTFTGGLNIHDPLSGRTRWPRVVDRGVERNMIYSLAEDADGDVWIGTTHGLFVRRAGTETIEPAVIPKLSEAFVFSLACDSGGSIWIGTRNNGLFRLDKASGTFDRITDNTPRHNFITTIAIDPHGDVWAGTNDGGVIRFERGSGLTSFYTEADGLPSNSIMGLVFDNRGAMWVSTDCGLCRFSTDPANIRTYTSSDGLPTNLFNYNSAFRATDGELFFGTVDGMISFRPDRIEITRPSLKVEFTYLQTEGRKTTVGEKGSPLDNDITLTSFVRLTYKQAAAIGFGFTALNFSHAADIRYSIRLSGASPSWHDLGTEHRIIFPRLRHGRYKFSVKASYDGVEWDEEGMRSIDIQVMPPLLLSAWAKIVYALLAIGVAAWIWSFVRARAAKLQAEETSRQKSVLFGNISHDLKTPLSLILGPLQRMVADWRLDPDTRDTLSVVLRNTQRMKNLLEELLMMNKIEMSQLKVTVQQGDVLELIDRMCDIFRVFAVETGIDFRVSIDNRDRRWVWFSPTGIERIVYNLLSNAFKFTPEGGTIRLKAWLHEDADTLRIEVADTGEGIDPAEHEKIFENYYTTAEQGKHKGAGIGLALTHSLVNLYNGDISVESSPGEGALFRVRIDVDRRSYGDEQTSPVPVETTRRPERNDPENDYLKQTRIEIRRQKPKRSKILIVEDNRELNEFVGRIFSADFDILSAFDGAEGYDVAIRELPDIIISDIVMPEMDGLEMTRRLKDELRTSHIPVALLTARSEESEKVEGFSQGADVYIEKPFNPQRLEFQIRNLLNTRQRNIERFKQEAVALDARELTRSPRDEKFLSSVVDVIMKNLDNENFAVKDITDELHVSRSLLHIKLKSLIDLSVIEFVHNIRMKEARERLSQGMNVSEASFAVGISDPNYFTKCFKKQFGQTPSDFIRTLKITNR